MQDPDNTVRETAGDALGQISEQLFSQGSILTLGDPVHNPMLKAAYDMLLEQKKELQQAGAYTLFKVNQLPQQGSLQHISCTALQIKQLAK